MPNILGLFLLPFVTALIVFAIPGLNAKNMKRLAFVLSILPLLYLIIGGYSWIGQEINKAWLPQLSIQFHLRVDTISLLFLYLTALIVPISILSERGSSITSPNAFYGLILLLQALLIGFFTARDLAVFTLFWEAMLIPLYFIITTWGGPHRKAAAIKFLIYMIAGSTLMVAAILALYLSSTYIVSRGSFNLDVLSEVSESSKYAAILFAIFMLAFAVKTPLFPFHAWLPDAYCQAPTSGTILLSALLSKAGIYGILRIGIELFPTQLQLWSPWLLGFAIAGVFYGGFAAWMQMDFKKIIAYSSLAHVNFILVGLFVWNQVGHSGAILQALNHGITIAALFLVAGWLERRLGDTKIGKVSGLCKFMPYLCWLTLFFVLSSVALPGTNNFIGELLILFGLFVDHHFAAAFLTLTVILSVIYMLRFMQKIYFDAPSLFQNSWVDIKTREFVIAAPLVILTLWLGLYPMPVVRLIEEFRGPEIKQGNELTLEVKK